MSPNFLKICYFVPLISQHYPRVWPDISEPKLGIIVKPSLGWISDRIWAPGHGFISVTKWQKIIARFCRVNRWDVPFLAFLVHLGVEPVSCWNTPFIIWHSSSAHAFSFRSMNTTQQRKTEIQKATIGDSTEFFSTIALTLHLLSTW